MKQVDINARIVRLEPGTTKSDRGRQFPLTDELHQLLVDQLASVEELKRQGTITPFVFHRADGRQIKSYAKAWQKARDAAGYPGKVPHDLRRTAVRNLERAGVARSTAMSMVGHETESIYRRYAIQDEASQPTLEWWAPGPRAGLDQRH